MEAHFIGGPWHGQVREVRDNPQAIRAPIQTLITLSQPGDFPPALSNESVTYAPVREFRVVDLRRGFEKVYREYEVEHG